MTAQVPEVTGRLERAAEWVGKASQELQHAYWVADEADRLELAEQIERLERALAKVRRDLRKMVKGEAPASDAQQAPAAPVEAPAPAEPRAPAEVQPVAGGEVAEVVPVGAVATATGAPLTVTVEVFQVNEGENQGPVGLVVLERENWPRTWMQPREARELAAVLGKGAMAAEREKKKREQTKRRGRK